MTVLQGTETDSGDFEEAQGPRGTKKASNGDPRPGVRNNIARSCVFHLRFEEIAEERCSLASMSVSVGVKVSETGRAGGRGGGPARGSTSGEHSTGGDWKPPAEGHCLQMPGKGGRVGKRQGNNPHGGRPRLSPGGGQLRQSWRNHRRRQPRWKFLPLEASNEDFMKLPCEELLHSRRMPPGCRDSESDLRNNSPN